jgi:hypothetical protein
MDFLARLFQEFGWWYSFLLVGSFVVGLVVLGLSLIRGSKRSAWTALLLSLVPLAIGLFGTYEANRSIESVLNSAGVQAKPDEVNDAYRVARTTSYVGAVLSVVLLPLAFAVSMPCCGVQARTTGDEPKV